MRSAKTVLGIIRLRRTLESRVLRKAHARFGEGRMEKCSHSNSPAAYSTEGSGGVDLRGISHQHGRDDGRAGVEEARSLQALRPSASAWAE